MKRKRNRKRPPSKPKIPDWMRSVLVGFFMLAFLPVTALVIYIIADFIGWNAN